MKLLQTKMTETVNFIGIILILVIKLVACEQNDSETDDKFIFANVVSLKRSCNLFRISLKYFED